MKFAVYITLLASLFLYACPASGAKNDGSNGSSAAAVSGLENLPRFYKTTSSDGTYKFLDRNKKLVGKVIVSNKGAKRKFVVLNTIVNISAFTGFEYGLTHVDLSPTKKIGRTAFYGKKLVNVMIPHSVTEIGEGAFMKNEIVAVIITNSAIEIGRLAFRQNPGLTTVSLPQELFDKLSEKELEEKFGAQVTTYQNLVGKRLTK